MLNIFHLFLTFLFLQSTHEVLVDHASWMSQLPPNQTAKPLIYLALPGVDLKRGIAREPHCPAFRIARFIHGNARSQRSCGE
jgi:hypothetical protein